MVSSETLDFVDPTDFRQMPESKIRIKLPERRDRIGSATAVGLISVALLIDLLQFVVYIFTLIPFVGLLVSFVVPLLLSICAWIMFAIWYKLLDVTFLDKLLTKGLAFFGTVLVEVIGLVNALPVWTFGTVVVIAFVRWEDRSYNEKNNLA